MSISPPRQRMIGVDHPAHWREDTEELRPLRQMPRIARLRQLLGSAPLPEKAASLSEPETVLPPCSCCGGRMIVIEFFERGMQPRYCAPSVAAIWFDTS
jgi:hypothetical protein